MDETCALDVAEQGGVACQTIADLTRTSKQRVQQVERRALAKSLRSARVARLLPSDVRDEPRGHKTTIPDRMDLDGMMHMVDRAYRRVVPEGKQHISEVLEWVEE
jgi:hypothetical protein